MIIFNGNAFARQREEVLAQKISQYYKEGGKKLKIAAVLFVEDEGSVLYTRLKAEAARRVDIDYEVHEFSLNSSTLEIVGKIQQLNMDPTVTGIIVQKPWRKTWVKATGIDYQDKKTERMAYEQWWTTLTSHILVSKDVDGLSPETMQSIKQGTWQAEGKVLPATCKAVASILAEADRELGFVDSKVTDERKFIIIGKSDLLGNPLYYELKRQNKNVQILGSKDLDERISSGQFLLDADVIISATGKRGLVKSEMLRDSAEDNFGLVLVDVGEPKPDVDFDSIKNADSEKVAFITPVPGGVGPMTIVSLLENCFDLVI